MNQMSRTIKALSTLNIYKSWRLKFLHISVYKLNVPVVRSPGGCEEWEWVLEPVCGGVGEGVLQPPRPRLARGRRRGRGQRPLPLPAVWVQLLLLVSHDLDSHHSYSYILIKVFVLRAQHTLAFCEKASRSSVCRFFHASPSSTLIALRHGEC